MADASSDKSLNFLFVEILENILRLAESPGECGSYMTEQIRELIRQRGWRFVIIVVAYYTIRDTLLYIVLPLLIARGIL